MSLVWTVWRLRRRLRSTIDRKVIERNDRAVLIHVSARLKIVAGQRVPELTDRAGCVQPELRCVEGSGRRGQIEMLVQRRAKRNEIHGAAKRVAALQIAWPEALGHADAVERRHGKLGQIQIAGVA